MGFEKTERGEGLILPAHAAARCILAVGKHTTSKQGSSSKKNNTHEPSYYLPTAYHRYRVRVMASNRRGVAVPGELPNFKVGRDFSGSPQPPTKFSAVFWIGGVFLDSGQDTTLFPSQTEKAKIETGWREKKQRLTDSLITDSRRAPAYAPCR